MDSGATKTLITRQKVGDRGYNMKTFTGGPTVMFAYGTVSKPVTEVVNMNNC